MIELEMGESIQPESCYALRAFGFDFSLTNCLQAADPEEPSDCTPLTVRDVLKRELIRMGTYLVMYGRDSALPGGVKIINELLDADLTAEETELLDMRDVRNAFEKVLAGQANRLASVADADLTDEMLMEIRAEDTQQEDF